MSTAASRSRSLALYRKLLRSSRTWPGPASEKKYILGHPYCRAVEQQNGGGGNEDVVDCTNLFRHSFLCRSEKVSMIYVPRKWSNEWR
ncbi:unnamed protein product [Calypogeia fissa]